MFEDDFYVCFCNSSKKGVPIPLEHDMDISSLKILVPIFGFLAVISMYIALSKVSMDKSEEWQSLKMQLQNGISVPKVVISPEDPSSWKTSSTSNLSLGVNLTPSLKCEGGDKSGCDGERAVPEEEPRMRLQTLKDDILTTLGCYGVPGLAVSVVQDGVNILSEGFGTTRPGGGVNVTSSTLFSLASLTKAFTAALLLEVLARNGSVKLSSTVKDVVGSGFLFNDSLRTEYATLEDLLAHRLTVPGNDGLRFNPDIDRHELLRRVRYFESPREFRVKGIYSSTNYLMISALTEILGNGSWEEQTKNILFQPLQMTSSQFAADINFDEDSVAPPFLTWKGKPVAVDPSFTKQWNSRCGSGCIFSTADDMAKWMNFYLSLGKNGHGEQVLSEKLVTSLLSVRSLLASPGFSQIQSPKFPVTLTGDQYGLGWRVGHYRGYPIYSHTGSTPGYSSILTLIPSKNFGVFLALNGGDHNNYYRLSLQNYIIDSLLGFEPWLNSSTICSFPSPWQPRASEQLPVYQVGKQLLRNETEYLGTYRNEGYGDIHVEFNTSLNGLTARFGFGHWQLHPQEAKDVFYGQGLAVVFFYDMKLVTFKTDGHSDAIISLRVTGFSPLLPPQFNRLR